MRKTKTFFVSLIDRNFKTFIVLSISGGACYLVFYSLQYCIQDLGLSNINQNGILFGITQCIGYLGILPFSHKIKRRMGLLVTNVVILIAGVLLFFLSKVEKTQTIRLAQSLISTFLMGVFDSVGQMFLYAITSESYPTKIRGAANALILYASKLLGSSFPYFKTWSLERGLHVMVGSCALSLIAIPTIFFVEETLVRADEKKKLNKVEA